MTTTQLTLFHGSLYMVAGGHNTLVVEHGRLEDDATYFGEWNCPWLCNM